MQDSTRNRGECKLLDLYRFYNADDELLYVGISLSAAHRASSHRALKPWWPEVSWMHVEHLGTRSRGTAEEIERAVIRGENPRYNIAGRTHPITPSPPLRTWSPEQEAIYEAVSHLLTSSSTYSPWTLEAIIDAVRDGVREAFVEVARETDTTPEDG